MPFGAECSLMAGSELDQDEEKSYTADKKHIMTSLHLAENPIILHRLSKLWAEFFDLSPKFCLRIKGIDV